MFAGTGNYERIAEKKVTIFCWVLMIDTLSILELPQSRTNNDLIRCSDTTNDNTGAKCPNILLVTKDGILI